MSTAINHTRGLTEKLVTAVGKGRPSQARPARVGPVQVSILQCIAAYPERAHGVGIAEHLRGSHDADLSDAQAYVAIKRLEARGYITARADTADYSVPLKRSRGRPHKFYKLTASGKRALEGVVAVNSGSNAVANMKVKNHADDNKEEETPPGLSPVVG